MISHRFRCIFIHIPRTGGSSIESVLWPGERSTSDLWMGFVSPGRNKYQTGGLQHLTARFVREEVGEETFSEYFKFAVVRNPFDKAISQYAFLRRRPDLLELLGLTLDDSFTTYLRALERARHVQWQPQVDFVYDGSELLVDRLIRFERFESEVAALFSQFNVGSPVPAIHASERAPFASYYDEEAKALVSAIYRADLEAFGYGFPERV